MHKMLVLVHKLNYILQVDFIHKTILECLMLKPQTRRWVREDRPAVLPVIALTAPVSLSLRHGHVVLRCISGPPLLCPLSIPERISHWREVRAMFE